MAPGYCEGAYTGCCEGAYLHSYLSYFVTEGLQQSLSLGLLPPASAIASVALHAPVPNGTNWYSNQRQGSPSTNVTWSGNQGMGTNQLPLASIPQMSTYTGFNTNPTMGWPNSMSQPLRGAGVSLSPCLEPFPQKLVDKVRSGTYVDMKELLGDNISLLKQLESLNISATLPALPGTLKPRLREVSSLASWLYCFLAYIGLQCQDPDTRDRVAYARLIIREAQRHGGQGWLEYDRIFRQQAALDPTIRWNVLQPAIQASTLLATPASQSHLNSAGAGSFCLLCQGVDHAPPACALAYLQPGAPPTTHPSTRPKRSAVFSHGLCISWNRGRCQYPRSCNFRHACSVCFQAHPAVDCPSKATRSRPSATPAVNPSTRS